MCIRDRDTLRAGELLALVDTEGWRTVLRDGVLALSLIHISTKATKT